MVKSINLSKAFSEFSGHGNVTGIGIALEEYSDLLPYYRVQNEQGGASAAVGAAKHLNRLCCFAATSSLARVQRI